MNAFISRVSTLFLPLRMAKRLGQGGILSPQRRAIITASYSVLWSIARGSRRERSVSLWFRGTPLKMVLESSADFALIREVFLDEEYRHPHIADCKNIFDVGANVGVASVYFNCLYPNAMIYAFEPDPILFEKLSSRVAGIANITPLQVALSDKNGEASFFRHSGSPLAGSLLSRAGDRDTVIVTTRTLSSIADELGIDSIDLLKFDIEGAERMLFASADDRTRAEKIIGEVHLDLLHMNKREFADLFPEFDLTYVRQTAKDRYIVRGQRHAPPLNI